jgi:hypothetical protein
VCTLGPAAGQRRRRRLAAWFPGARASARSERAFRDRYVRAAQTLVSATKVFVGEGHAFLCPAWGLD